LNEILLFLEEATQNPIASTSRISAVSFQSEVMEIRPIETTNNLVKKQTDNNGEILWDLRKTIGMFHRDKQRVSNLKRV
jgi:uncharacterized protein YegL